MQGPLKSILLPVLLLASASAACSSVPYTGRSQLRLVGETEETRMGLEAWQEILKDARVIRGTPADAQIQEVGRRIADASGAPFAWEFVLIDDDETVNAFCLPGGKVAVYTGILPITQNADGLAAVLGHEVAHATAHHGAERVSQELIASGVMTVASTSLANESALVREAVMKGLGVGAQVGAILPYSRLHEHEADEIGLRYMVRAGYDPSEAVRLWQRMEQLGGRDTPEFLSTHPDPGARSRRIAERIPQVLAEERGRPSAR